MTASEVSGGEFRARAGTLTLLYVASATDREALLQMLEGALSGGALLEDDEPVDEVELEDLESLELPGVEVTDEADDAGMVLDPDVVDVPEIILDSGQVAGPNTRMRLTPAGEEMLFVGATIERWLSNAPGGPLELGRGAAGSALAALVCGWSSTVIHALAAEPLTLPELNSAVEILSYETVEEHVDALERADQVEALPGKNGTRYAATDWLREGIAPLGAAARLERHQPAHDTAPPDSLDVEASFLLALPLLKLPPEISGSCRLGVQIGGGAPHLAGVTTVVEEGRVVSSAARVDEQVDTWATGSAHDWLDTLVDPSAARVKSGGDQHLAGALLEGLHEKLFGIPVR